MLILTSEDMELIRKQVRIELDTLKSYLGTLLVMPPDARIGFECAEGHQYTIYSNGVQVSLNFYDLLNKAREGKDAGH